MGWPGTGVELPRVGIPGRGGGGWACPGAGRTCCCCSRATRSGRGGTIGRAAGCPAKFGRAGEDRRGMDGAGPGVAGGAGGPGDGAWVAIGDVSAGGAAARALGCGGAAGPGEGCGGGADAGMGCRGPERIWPGRGAAGTGRAGIAPVRNGGWIGALPPLNNGGRNGATLRGSSAGVAVTLSAGGAAAVSAAGDGAALAAMTGCSGT